MHFNEWKVLWGFFSNSNLKIVLKGPIGNKSVLVQIMAWCRTGDKPLSESILNHFTYAYMRHNMTQITVMANILHGLWTNKKNTPHCRVMVSEYWELFHFWEKNEVYHLVAISLTFIPIPSYSCQVIVNRFYDWVPHGYPIFSTVIDLWIPVYWP